jgi:hypothetical protein
MREAGIPKSFDYPRGFRVKEFRFTDSLPEKKDLPMKRNSTIIALIIGLTFMSLACSKSGTATNMSEDDKHKLFQAVGRTGDQALILEVAKKIGLSESSGQPTPAFQPFLKAHMEWGPKNADFVREVMDAEKAKAYVKSHMP